MYIFQQILEGKKQTIMYITAQSAWIGTNIELMKSELIKFNAAIIVQSQWEKGDGYLGFIWY